MAKVVIADDEEFVRKFLISVMHSLSFNVVAEVEKGDEICTVLKKTNPDILLLDINMPNLTGLEFLDMYAQKFPKTCIIILTSASSVYAMQKAANNGAQCFLRKDLAVEKMIAGIQNAWDAFNKKG